MRFEWDRAKAEANRRKHHASFDEAASVFFDPRSVTIVDPDHSSAERHLVTIGVSSNGRLLVVAHTEQTRRLTTRSSGPGKTVGRRVAPRK